ncbi:hypothetical protein NKDENANG_03676 [Candidatus Entotheonellaceae bacterium PAL068K]
MHEDDNHPEPLHVGSDTIIEDIERFSFNSVGIDIGSSASHLVFSHLTMKREGAGLSAKLTVTVTLTPYSSGTLIDTDQVKDFMQTSYQQAGYTHDDIDTGAAVINDADDPDAVLFLILDVDVARSLGGILKENL